MVGYAPEKIHCNAFNYDVFCFNGDIISYNPFGRLKYGYDLKARYNFSG